MCKFLFERFKLVVVVCSLFVCMIDAYGMGGRPSLPKKDSDGDSYAATKYPIVLIHGFRGYEKLDGIDYFYQIKDELEKRGATVFVPTLSAVHSHEHRGEQLLFALKRYKEIYGHQRFHLFGHSQGGTAARYVAAVAPHLVSSVFSIGTPHTGSRLLDYARKSIDIEGLVKQDTLAVAKKILSKNSCCDYDVESALFSLSSEGSEMFNKRFSYAQPMSCDVHGTDKEIGVKYYSIGGVSSVSELPVFKPIEAWFDWLKGVALFGSGLIAEVWQGEANDGVVGQCSSRWGRVLRDDYPLTHDGLINQPFGKTQANFKEKVSVISIYASHANRLKNEGL